MAWRGAGGSRRAVISGANFHVLVAACACADWLRLGIGIEVRHDGYGKARSANSDDRGNWPPSCHMAEKEQKVDRVASCAWR